MRCVIAYHPVPIAVTISLQRSAQHDPSELE
jgi:hypothetical protein